MDKAARHYDKVVITLIMCLAVLFMATFSPFAQPVQAVELVSGAIIAILIAGLAAVGITFVTTGAFNSLEEQVESLFIEYAQSQGTTTNALLKGCQSGTNKLGQLLLNNKFVILISLFGAWIMSKYSLANNSITVVQAQGATLDDLQLYSFPILMDGRGVDDREYTILTATAPCYCVFGLWNNSSIMLNFISNEVATIRKVTINSIGHVTSSTDITLQYNSGYGLYYEFDSLTASYFTNSGYTIYSYADVTTALSGNGEIDYNNIGIDIVTGDITLPLDDDNYTDGDGAIIDLDNSWGTTYSDITENIIPDEFSDSKEGSARIEYVSEDDVTQQVEETQETTNLPSGVIPFTPLALPSFNLVSIWHYVQQWISDTAIAAGSLMAIATQAPSPMVNLFYAIACLAIIFGFIKGLAK